MTDTTLGARIAAARERAGLNKNQLARLLGTSWQHVDHWERDRTQPSTASLQRLAQVLGATVAQLLGDAGDAAAGGEALETFLRAYAPGDLAESELAWLRAAPIDPARATPGQYLDLLHRLRTPTLAAVPPRARTQPPPAAEPVTRTPPGTQPPPARTGKRKKVRVEDALAVARPAPRSGRERRS